MRLDSGIGHIEGVFLQPLTIIRDERGAVMHMLRADSGIFSGFGEIYFSLIKQDVVKAWKRHRRMTQNIAVPIGEIRLVIYDSRDSCATCGNIREVVTGANNYQLIRIPPMVWYGFQGLAADESVIANCTSIPHDPAESERLDACSPLIPFRWAT